MGKANAHAEELCCQILENLEDCAVIALDPGGRVARWSRGAARLLGHTAEEMLGEPIARLYAPAAIESGEPEKELQSAIEQGRVEGKTVVVRKDGSRFRGSVVTTALRDREGRLIGFGRMIHESEKLGRGRAEEEEALRAAREEGARGEAEAANDRIARILENITDAYFSVDRDWRFTYANRLAQAMGETLLAKEPAEVVGQELWAVAPVLRGTRFERELRRAMTEQAPVHFEDCLPPCNVWFAVNASPSPDGLSVYFRDVTEGRRAEEELSKTTQMLRAVVEASPLPIGALDPEGNVLLWNRAFERIFGWSADEVLGKPYPLAPELRHGEFRGLFESVLRGDAISGIELERRSKYGSDVPVRIWTAPMRDAEGRIQGAAVLFEDITERKRAEEEQRRLIAIFDASPNLLAMADAQGRILSVNRGGRRILGIEAEEVAGLTIADLHPEWAAAVALGEGLPAAIREGDWRGETVLLTRDGREIPVSEVIVALKGPDGDLENIAIILWDIADRKQLEENLRYLVEASQTLVATLEYDAMVQNLVRLAVPRLADYSVIDAVEGAEIRRVAKAHRDPAKEELLGRVLRYPAGQHRPVGLPNVIRTGKPELVPEVTEAWMRAAAVEEEQFRAIRELSPRSVMIVPLIARGRILGAMLFAAIESGRTYGPEDLSLAEELARRAALALDNTRLYREAMQATRIRDEVLSFVAHDLRNPLNTILLSAGLLLETTAEEKTTERNQLDIIRRSVEQANRLIEDLLDVARMEARQFTVQQERVKTAPLVLEAVELNRALSDAKGIGLKAELPDVLPAVEVDRHRILEVFSNLIGNAIKFSSEGGRITVGAEAAPDDVRFSVSDTGPGIPDDQLTHLFDPFWQAQKGVKAGAGLGLTISRGIVEAHGGKIWVDSEVSVGTTFYFTVPRPATVKGNERRAASDDRQP